MVFSTGFFLICLQYVEEEIWDPGSLFKETEIRCTTTKTLTFCFRMLAYVLLYHSVEYTVSFPEY